MNSFKPGDLCCYQDDLAWFMVILERGNLTGDTWFWVMTANGKEMFFSDELVLIMRY